MTTIYTAKRRRRAVHIEVFDCIGATGYKVTGTINGTELLSYQFMQAWQAHEKAREFLQHSSWWDMFVKSPKRRVRHAKY